MSDIGPIVEEAAVPETVAVSEETGQVEVVQEAVTQAVADVGAAIGTVEALVELVRQQPGIVPELIGGTTAEEVSASIAVAKAAYAAARTAVLKEMQTVLPMAAGGPQEAPKPTTGQGMIYEALSHGE